MTPLIEHRLAELRGYFEGDVRVLRHTEHWALLLLTPTGAKPIHTIEAFRDFINKGPIRGTNMSRNFVMSVGEPFLMLLNPWQPDHQSGTVQ